MVPLLALRREKEELLALLEVKEKEKYEALSCPATLGDYNNFSSLEVSDHQVKWTYTFIAVSSIMAHVFLSVTYYNISLMSLSDRFCVCWDTTTTIITLE